MTIDLILGFRDKRKDLAETLGVLGFTLKRVVPKGDEFEVAMEYYELYDPSRSKKSVYFVYHDGIYADHHEFWKNIVEDLKTIVATGSLTTTMGRSAFAQNKQEQVGRFLRNHYDAILYDPQSGTLITD